MMVRFAALMGLSLAFATPAAAQKGEMRCGWLHNPTPANWSLVDRDGEWVLGTQGGAQAPGMDLMPDFSGPQWVRTNGYYGYGCACLTVEVDRAAMRVTRVVAARQQALSVCRADRRLPRP